MAEEKKDPIDVKNEELTDAQLEQVSGGSESLEGKSCSTCGRILEWGDYAQEYACKKCQPHAFPPWDRLRNG